MTRQAGQNAGLTEESVREALRATAGSPSAAARILGVGRQTVIYWIRTRNIRIERVVLPADDTAA